LRESDDEIDKEWSKLVTMTDPCVCDPLFLGQGPRPFKKLCDVVLKMTILVDTSSTRVPLSSLLVCVGVVKNNVISTNKKRKKPSSSSSSSSSSFNDNPPDIGKISNVKISFLHQGVEHVSPIVNESLTGGFMGATRRMPPNVFFDNFNHLKPYMNDRIFPIPCTEEFLKYAQQVEAKDIRVDLTCELSFD
jgi:hypothetical protein